MTENYTPPYFYGLAMFLAISNLLEGQKRHTLAVGEGTPPYLKILKRGWRSAVGEWS